MNKRHTQRITWEVMGTGLVVQEDFDYLNRLLGLYYGQSASHDVSAILYDEHEGL